MKKPAANKGIPTTKNSVIVIGLDLIHDRDMGLALEFR